MGPHQGLPRGGCPAEQAHSAAGKPPRAMAKRRHHPAAADCTAAAQGPSGLGAPRGRRGHGGRKPRQHKYCTRPRRRGGVWSKQAGSVGWPCARAALPIAHARTHWPRSQLPNPFAKRDPPLVVLFFMEFDSGLSLSAAKHGAPGRGQVSRMLADGRHTRRRARTSLLNNWRADCSELHSLLRFLLLSFLLSFFLSFKFLCFSFNCRMHAFCVLFLIDSFPFLPSSVTLATA